MTDKIKSPCNCRILSSMNPKAAGVHHSHHCKKYKTEKFVYLCYYDDVLKYWCLAPSETLILMGSESRPVEEAFYIHFIRKEMTDEEFDELPK